MKTVIRNSIIIFVFVIIEMISLVSCRNSNEKKRPNMETKKMVMTCDLADNPEVIQAYKKYHSNEHIWPEVNKAAEVSGYESIEIFQFGNRLVMILEYPENLSLEKINERYANSNPEKMKEWADLMSSFQQAPPGADSAKTWVEMEAIYIFRK